ncbi:MAG TPA: NBR1-Ig-like domain-containing protein [Anaerolineales bacterium]|nr:NBR1-Ig-like domain-containing protein [Anaerolineales bacterium]
MKKIWILTLLTALSLASCIKVSQQAATPTPALFVTATLPPTKPGLSLPTDTPGTSQTPDTSATAETPGASGETDSAGAACRDSAILLEDVTVPDNAQMQYGQKFTKTWRFQNNGKCKWSGYTIVFVAGDRMSSPDSAPIPETEAGKTVDVSVNLTAPSLDGGYTGYYELRNAKGETLAVGTEKTFWVKILIGNAIAAAVPTIAITPISGTPVIKVTGPASCNYSTSSSYANEVANLINSARAQAGLAPLSVNAQLAAAAQGHSIDMACHGVIGHTGSDGSSVHERIVAAGYSPSYSSEIIYGSGYPQTAFDWWMSDQTHRNEILRPNVTEMGVGYAYVADTAAGGYYTVDFASP